MVSIYLASRSPRRRELLQQIGVNFQVVAFRGGARADIDVNEDALPGETPDDYVCRVARAKANGGMQRVIWRGLAPRPVLAADTTIDVDGEIIGKPEDAAHAHAVLTRLSGRSHRVLTAIAMNDGARLELLLNVSEVRFRTLSAHEIDRYVASGEPMDKAGAYGIQGRAAIFVAEIRGSYSGIMGLPLCETAQLLGRFGYPL